MSVKRSLKEAHEKVRFAWTKYKSHLGRSYHRRMSQRCQTIYANAAKQCIKKMEGLKLSHAKILMHVGSGFVHFYANQILLGDLPRFGTHRRPVHLPRLKSARTVQGAFISFENCVLYL